MIESTFTDRWMERLVSAAQIDLLAVIQEVVSRTRDLCEADDASLLLRDRSTGELNFDPVRIHSRQDIIGAAAKTGRSINTGSQIAVALRRGTEVLGVLEAVRASSHPPFEERHLRLLESLVPQVALAVQNAQLLEGQQQIEADNATLETKVQERTTLLSRAKWEWEQTFDAMDEPIALQDGFILRRVNRAYAQRAGLTFQEILGKTCHSIFAQRAEPCVGCAMVQEKTEGQSGEISTYDGARYTLSAYTLAFVKGSRVPATVVQYRNVTRQRQMEQRLRETERLVSIGQLASGAAHEINNPLGFVISNLTGLRSNLEEMSKKPSDDLLRETYQMIAESLEGAGRVKEIVRGLRELSRLEVGRDEPACVNASVTRAVRGELGADAANVTCELHASGKVSIPPLQLDNALSHILRNARQAITANQRIKVTTRDIGERVEVEIADEGCGIAAENIHRIFEPFFTTRGIGRGIGLGLTAAYGIITRHAGSLEAHSTAGKGSRFLIRLPMIQTGKRSPKTATAVGAPAAL